MNKAPEFNLDEPDFSEHDKRERLYKKVVEISDKHGAYLVDRHECEVGLEEHKAFAKEILLALEEL